MGQFLLEEAKKQGFSLVLLACAVLWFGRELSIMKEDYRKLADKYENYMIKDRQELIEVVKENTKALEGVNSNKKK